MSRHSDVARIFLKNINALKQKLYFSYNLIGQNFIYSSIQDTYKIKNMLFFILFSNFNTAKKVSSETFCPDRCAHTT